MGWSIGYDKNWKRDVGYGVPAWCDHPDCNEKIDRGLAYVCGSDPLGGEEGCGLYFCSEHLGYGLPPGIDEQQQIALMMKAASDGVRLLQLCERCLCEEDPFPPKPEHPEWILHVLKDHSWHQWRTENPKQLQRLKKQLAEQVGGA